MERSIEHAGAAPMRHVLRNPSSSPASCSNSKPQPRRRRKKKQWRVRWQHRCQHSASERVHRRYTVLGCRYLEWCCDLYARRRRSFRYVTLATLHERKLKVREGSGLKQGNRYTFSAGTQGLFLPSIYVLFLLASRISKQANGNSGRRKDSKCFSFASRQDIYHKLHPWLTGIPQPYAAQDCCSSYWRC